MIPIDKGIPCPPHRNTRWPWDALSQGDSFAYSGDLHTAKSLVTQRHRKHPERFRASYGPQGEVRIWRIS